MTRKGIILAGGSPSFGKWVGIELSANNKRQLWIPPGFTHVFMVTSESTEFLYKTTDYWFPEHELSLLWFDPMVGVQWPLDGGPPKLAAKDAAGTRRAIVISSVWQAVKRLSVLACQLLPTRLQI